MPQLPDVVVKICYVIVLCVSLGSLTRGADEVIHTLF